MWYPAGACSIYWSSFCIVDLVFAYLFPETGKVFLYATLVLGFFAFCVLIWDFVMTFQDYRKAALYEEIEGCFALGTPSL